MRSPPPSGPVVFLDSTAWHWESLHGRFAKAVFSRVRLDGVIVSRPGIQIALEVLQALVDFLAKGRRVKLILHRLVEALANLVRLGPTSPHLAVIDILYRR